MLQLLSEKERGEYVIRHNVDGLLRGGFKSRQEGLQIQKQNGIINANEWRSLENMNNRLGGDEYREAANIYGDTNKGVSNA